MGCVIFEQSLGYYREHSQALSHINFLTARRNVVPRAVYVIAQIPGGRTGGRAGGRADGRADGRTETKLSSSNSAKTVRDRRLVSMEH
jgi:hypothetical protein